MSDHCTICDAPIEDTKGSLVSSVDGHLFHFCSLECLKIFQAYPEAYMGEIEMELKTVEDTAW